MSINPVRYEIPAYTNLLELLLLIRKDPENNPKAKTTVGELLSATLVHEIAGQIGDARASEAIRSAAGAVMTEKVRQIAKAA